MAANQSDPSPLLSSRQLAGELDRWVVIDASVVKVNAPDERKAYRADRDGFERDGHLPGARFADLIDDFSDPQAAFPFTRPSARQFQAAARQLGLSKADRIVVYDRSTGIWAARLWWLLRAFGHAHVAVLDGGLRHWQSQGFPITTSVVKAPEGDFEAVEQAGYFIDLAGMRAIVEGHEQAQVLNVLRRPVFEGRERSYARPGHIPGSLNVPYAELLDPVTNTLLSRQQIAERFGAVLTRPTAIVTYCGGGITAAGAALALAHMGRTDVAVYDGSLNEWASEPDLPLVVAT